MIIYLASITSSLWWRAAMANMHRLQCSVGLLGEAPFEHATLSCSSSSRRFLDQMLLWSLVIGIFASANYPKEAEFFMQRAVVVARRLALKSYLDLHRMMGSFCHSDTLQHSALSQLSGRLHRLAWLKRSVSTNKVIQSLGAVTAAGTVHISRRLTGVV